jgi:UDP-N-acetylmuramate dehydrogenase
VHGIAVHVLGSGFNTLVRDGGIRGLVLRLAGLRALAREEDGALRAEAGASHTSVARFCVEQGLAGLEFAVGIPGTVGGWIRMNAGIGTHEMKDVIDEVELFAPASARLEKRSRDTLAFRYRGVDLPDGAVIVSARFRTRSGDPARIEAEQRELLARRRATQPVDRPSCGSVFVNPPGDHAGRLIDAAGLKGAREGGAEISTLHANFIVTSAGATASDVLALLERTRREVARRFGVSLETEVRIVGEPL